MSQTHRREKKRERPTRMEEMGCVFEGEKHPQSGF